jgi:hypothetical protein
MKIICPDPACNSTKIELLFEAIYKCNECGRVFSINPDGGIIIDRRRGGSPGPPKHPIPLKIDAPEFPTVFIKIGIKGISQKLLTKKIRNVEGISKYKINSVLKELKLE